MESLLSSFKNEVGNYCAVCAFIELSLRSMRAEHKDDLENEESFLAFSKMYNICLSTCDPDLLATAVPQYYILNVYRCFESFLQSLYHFIRNCEFGGKDFTRSKDESWLDCINRRLGERITEEQKELYVICNYYHYIRNYAAHSGDDNNKAARKAAFSRINRERCSTDAIFKKLDAPNWDDSIIFDDFILFSRTAIQLAEAYWKSVQLDYVAVIEELPTEILRTWGSVKNNKKRLAEKVKRYLMTNYCMKPEEYTEEITKVVERRLSGEI